MAAFSSLLLDPLCCQERHWEVEDYVELSLHGDQEQELISTVEEKDEEEEEQWAEVLSSLVTKELETHPDGHPEEDDGNPYLRSARLGAVEWVARACARHGFSALTAVLAVGYLDRCRRTGRLQQSADRPWMGRLLAVACLSLAAKVEETHVPHFLDLQVSATEDEDEEEEEEEANARYVFEGKTVRRMELLVLSALGWRMNPVTPLSFIHHLLPKLCTTTAAAAPARLRELMRRCHTILLSALADWRWVRYPPSVSAGATLLHAMGQPLEPGSGSSSEYIETHHLLALLNLTKERVEGCYRLILESMGGRVDVGVGNKRKHRHYYHSSPPSPNGVISSCFSCDSSSDSWATWPSSVSSSPEPPSVKKPNRGIAGELARDDDDGEQVLNCSVFT